MYDYLYRQTSIFLPTQQGRLNWQQIEKKFALHRLPYFLQKRLPFDYFLLQLEYHFSPYHNMKTRRDLPKPNSGWAEDIGGPPSRERHSHGDLRFARDVRPAIRGFRRGRENFAQSLQALACCNEPTPVGNRQLHRCKRARHNDGGCNHHAR